MIGYGYEEMERVVNLFEAIKRADIVFFPDVYYGDLQEHLVSLGKRVWGCRTGDELELDREKSKEMLDSVGVDIGPYKVVTGMDARHVYLAADRDVVVHDVAAAPPCGHDRIAHAGATGGVVGAHRGFAGKDDLATAYA